MKKFLNSKYGEAIVLIVSSVFTFIFNIIFYSAKLTNGLDIALDIDNMSIWNMSELYTDRFVIKGLNVIFIVALIVGLILFVLSAVIVLLKRKKWGFYVSFIYNLVLCFSFLIFHVVLKVLSAGAIVCVVLSIIVSALSLVFLVLRRKRINDAIGEDEKKLEVSKPRIKVYKIALFVCECVAAVIMLAVFLVPLYTESIDGETVSYFLIKSFVAGGSYPVYLSVISLVFLVAFLVAIMYFAYTLSYFFGNEKEFVKKSQKYLYGGAVFTLLSFIVGYGTTFGLTIKNSANDIYSYSVSTVSYVPFILMLIVLVAFSVFHGKIGVFDSANENDIKSKRLKIEPLIYVIILTAITFLLLALNIIEVEVVFNNYVYKEVKLNGYQLLTTYKDLESGFQIFAFVMFSILLTSAIMLVLSTASLLAKYKGYYKIVKASAFVNFCFVMAVSLFALYFSIAQKVNMENIVSLLNSLGIDCTSFEYVSNAKSQSHYAFIASFAVLLIMFFRGRFNLSFEQASSSAAPSSSAPVAKDRQSSLGDSRSVSDFDACPAFTELDEKENDFNLELEQKKANALDNPTLPGLVRFVVDYARESRLHLSYSLDDIATFVAGLGASRLTILQGMSGTGKTSLPKIFTEAIMGVCDIVEVESSWRDKNELLGYYNEFSKRFTPKKFTQCLYKARLNSSVPTLIVLDEMNLSRIEYYFSDFLSLMEHEEDKREIKLLNVKLCRLEGGAAYSYKGLNDGHTIKIPSNVWFIGTANKDESTFEISDKVYDRAQTMNFNKRAPKIRAFGEPMSPKYVSYETMTKLFYEAKQSFAFDAEDNLVIQKAENLLRPYNISFGNRILKQMEDFVKIYCACFTDKNAAVNVAVEKILLSKVVAKLEYKIVENKESLAVEFDKLGLFACGEFIRKLNED